MAHFGSLLLNEYPAATVRLACTKCERKGRYRKGNLIAKYGADIPLPTLLATIAKCEKAEKFQGCGAFYEDLMRDVI